MRYYVSLILALVFYGVQTTDPFNVSGISRPTETTEDFLSVNPTGILFAAQQVFEMRISRIRSQLEVQPERIQESIQKVNSLEHLYLETMNCPSIIRDIGLAATEDSSEDGDDWDRVLLDMCPSLWATYPVDKRIRKCRIVHNSLEKEKSKLSKKQGSSLSLLRALMLYDSALMETHDIIAGRQLSSTFEFFSAKYLGDDGSHSELYHAASLYERVATVFDEIKSMVHSLTTELVGRRNPKSSTLSIEGFKAGLSGLLTPILGHGQGVEIVEVFLRECYLRLDTPGLLLSVTKTVLKEFQIGTINSAANRVLNAEKAFSITLD